MHEIPNFDPLHKGKKNIVIQKSLKNIGHHNEYLENSEKLKQTPSPKKLRLDIRLGSQDKIRNFEKIVCNKKTPLNNSNIRKSKSITKIKNLFLKSKLQFENEELDMIENLPFKKTKIACPHTNKITKKLDPTFDNIKKDDKIRPSLNLLRNMNYNEKIEDKKRINSTTIQTIDDLRKKSIKINDYCETNEYLNSILGKSYIIKNPGYDRNLISFDNIIDSLSDDELKESVMYSGKSFILFRLKGKFKKYWDYIVILLILYSIFFFPLESSLILRKKNYISIMTEIITELIFLIDIGFNFFFEIYDSEENIISLKKIIIHNYFFGYFLFDFLITIPLRTISILFVIDEFSSLFYFLSWIKSLRIFRIFKFELISEAKYFSNNKLNRIVKIFILFLFLVHISTCLWIFIGKITESTTWINYFIPMNYENGVDIYTSSLYFNLVTIFSIGYGDIYPINLNERIFTILLLIIGTLLYSFFISSLSNLFKDDDKKKKLLKKRI